MAYDEGVAQRIRQFLGNQAGISERKMFGGIAFMAGGHMFIGVTGSTLMARVGPDQYASSLGQPHVREMDFTGKPMKGYVYVDPAGFESDRALRHWVQTSHRFASSLPPKPAK